MRALAFILLAVAIGLAAVPPAGASAPAAFVVIVSPDNAVESLSRKFLTDAFLKKSTRWADGEVIRPVDQAPDSTVRRRFSDEVLKRSVPAVRSYWQQLIFAGRDVPPPEVASDEQVVDYVLKHTGAVGYVSGSAKLGGTKVIRLE